MGEREGERGREIILTYLLSIYKLWWMVFSASDQRKRKLLKLRALSFFTATLTQSKDEARHRFVLISFF